MRSRTRLIEWSTSLRRTRVARGRVGRMFSTKLGSLMVFHRCCASAIASSSDSCAKWWKCEFGLVKAVLRSVRNRLMYHCSMS